MHPRLLAVAALALSAACGRAPSGPSASPAHGPVIGSPPKDEQSGWWIEPGRVGDIAIGRPIPEHILEGDLERHYVARYFADAQPLEGFRFDDPPLTMVLDAGPFAELDRRGLDGPPPVEALRAKGTEAARRGAKVRGILVHGPGPVTREGVGVGSTLADLEAAYPRAVLSAIPEAFGGDACVVSTPSAEGLFFIFASCDRARAGDPVLRVDQWAP